MSSGEPIIYMELIGFDKKLIQIGKCSSICNIHQNVLLIAIFDSLIDIQYSIFIDSLFHQKHLMIISENSVYGEKQHNSKALHWSVQACWKKKEAPSAYIFVSGWTVDSEQGQQKSWQGGVWSFNDEPFAWVTTLIR